MMYKSLIMRRVLELKSQVAAITRHYADPFLPVANDPCRAGKPPALKREARR
jgi:hypothetical protein